MRKLTWTHVALAALLLLVPADSLVAREPVVASPGVSCQDLPLLFRAFTQRHYATRRIDVPVQQHTVARFIEIVDPSKSLLLGADVDKLRQDLPAAFEQAKSGDCHALEDAWDLITRRVEEDAHLVAATLTPKFKLDDNTELVLDPEERQYATTAEVRAKRVRDSVQFEISNYLVAGLSLDQAKKQLVHRYELTLKRLKERRERGELPGLWAEAFAEALDPHSAYMAPDELADFEIAIRLSLEGIGAVLTTDNGFTVIQSLVPGGQAEKTGQLRPRDKITAVAQEGEAPVPTIDMDLTDVVKMIRGKKGTKVTLTILREGKTAETFSVTIVRDKIDVSSQAAKITYEKRDIGKRALVIGVIDLPSFYGGEEGGRSSTQDMKRLLEEARAKKVDGILLDLSRNGGGLLEEAVTISGLFIRRGAVVGTKGTDGRLSLLDDTDSSVVWPGPVAVVVSRASASASEILAGALKDYHRALIVGSDKTFGKGSVQVVMPMPAEVGAIRVTSGMFFLPGGQSTQIRGVTSDVRIPSAVDGFEIGEDKLSYPLATQAVAAFLSPDANALGNGHWEPVAPALVSTLAERSKVRVAADPGFAKIREELDRIAKEKGVVRLGDLRKRAKDKPRRNPPGELDEHPDALQQTVLNESVNILVDALVLAGDAGSSSVTAVP